MTKDQLNNLLKVLDTGSLAALDDDDRVRSREWRREKVHTTSEVSVGSLLHNRERCAEGD